MKKMMFLGLLMILGLSFAQLPPPTSGVEWNVFKQTTCQGLSAMSLVYDIYGIPYYVGDTCSQASMPYDMEDLCDQVCWDGGFYDYYFIMSMECNINGWGSPACFTAKNQFYSSARNARGMFSATNTAHLLAARQALYANRMWLCGTDSSVVSEVLYESSLIYRECLSTDPDDFFGELGSFCSYVCPLTT